MRIIGEGFGEVAGKVKTSSLESRLLLVSFVG